MTNGPYHQAFAVPQGSGVNSTPWGGAPIWANFWGTKCNIIFYITKFWIFFYFGLNYWCISTRFGNDLTSLHSVAFSAVYLDQSWRIQGLAHTFRVAHATQLLSSPLCSDHKPIATSMTARSCATCLLSAHIIIITANKCINFNFRRD